MNSTAEGFIVCPYCDGGEHREQRLGVYGADENALGSGGKLTHRASTTDPKPRAMLSSFAPGPWLLIRRCRRIVCDEHAAGKPVDRGLVQRSTGARTRWPVRCSGVTGLGHVASVDPLVSAFPLQPAFGTKSRGLSASRGFYLVSAVSKSRSVLRPHAKEGGRIASKRGQDPAVLRKITCLPPDVSRGGRPKMPGIPLKNCNTETPTPNDEK